MTLLKLKRKWVVWWIKQSKFPYTRRNRKMRGLLRENRRISSRFGKQIERIKAL